jgi:hypothetical protein
MHVLPLPFGLALAVLPRRDAQLLRHDKDEPIRVYRGPSPRDLVWNNPKFTPCRRQIV